MTSFNKVILAGNLTRDPELRHTASGTAVCDLGLAINDKRKTASGEWVDETTFVDVTAWSKTAEAASEHLKKGSPVLIEGKLKLDTWKTPEGQKRSKLKVTADRVEFLADGKKSSQSESRRQHEDEPEPVGANRDYGGCNPNDIPF